MRNTSILVLIALLSGVGLWYARLNLRVANTTQRTITGDVVIDGQSLLVNGAVLPNGALALAGDLHMRSLPDGRVVLEGNLNVSRSSN